MPWGMVQTIDRIKFGDFEPPPVCFKNNSFITVAIGPEFRTVVCGF
jgi:hypothetical protein